MTDKEKNQAFVLRGVLSGFATTDSKDIHQAQYRLCGLVDDLRGTFFPPETDISECCKCGRKVVYATNLPLPPDGPPLICNPCAQQVAKEMGL